LKRHREFLLLSFFFKVQYTDISLLHAPIESGKEKEAYLQE